MNDMAIVLVDSNRENLERLRKEVQLHKPNDEIVTFEDGSRALQYLNLHPVTEVIADVNSGSMDGCNVVRTIKSKFRNIRAILMSADRNKALYAWEIRADYFLLKPYTSADVGECFRSKY